MRTVANALGDYAIETEPDLFMPRERAHPTGLLDLRGVRFATCQETDAGRRLDVAVVKRLTGGDTIRARRMRQDYIEFTPSHQPFLITNQLPKVLPTTRRFGHASSSSPSTRASSGAKTADWRNDSPRIYRPCWRGRPRAGSSTSAWVRWSLPRAWLPRRPPTA